MVTFESKKEVSSVEDVYSEINSRMIAALMFHDQMADYFTFLGLPGYAKIHSRQYHAECREREEMKTYYIQRHGRILNDKFTGKVEVIPKTWKNVKSFAVGKGTKQKAVEDGFLLYREWEEETGKLYETYSKALYDGGNVIDALKVGELARHTAEELLMIDAIMIDLISSGYDMVYIAEMQKRYTEKEVKKHG